LAAKIGYHPLLPGLTNIHPEFAYQGHLREMCQVWVTESIFYYSWSLFSTISNLVKVVG
jgi:hypothetical protein